MSPHAHPRMSRSDRRRPRRMASVAIAIVAALAVGVPVSAATITNTWSAKIGSSGVNGTAKITALGTGTGTVALKVAKMKPSTLLPVVISKGSCSSVGTTVVTLASIKTNLSGAATRTSTLTAGQVTAISNATRGTGRIAIRIGSGTARKCGWFAVPTPIVGATIGVGLSPRDIAIAPVGLWVTNSVGQSISLINPKTNAVISVVDVPVPGNTLPWAIAVGFGSLFVTLPTYDDTGDTELVGSVARLDPATGALISVIPVGRSPFEVAISPEAIWVTNFSDGTVSRIDPISNTVTATIPVGAGPFGIAAGAGAIWVSNETGATVSRIDPVTNTVVSTITSFLAPEGITFGLGSVWVADAGHEGVSDGTVSRIDPATNAVVAIISVGLSPVSVSTATGSVWVDGYADVDTKAVRIDPATNAVKNRVDMGVNSWGLVATDHAVWVVHPIAVGNDPTDYTLPGTVSRINY